MADLLVERVTGQASAEDVNVEVQLMMPLDRLLDPTVERAAQLLGYRPAAGPTRPRDGVEQQGPQVVASVVHPSGWGSGNGRYRW